MRLRDFFTLQVCELGFLWKAQMLLGVFLVLSAVAVVLMPEILVALVAGTILAAGGGLIGSAWRMRQFQHHAHGFSVVDTLEW